MSPKCHHFVIIGFITLSLLGVILITYFEYKATAEKPIPVDRHNRSKCHTQYNLGDSIKVSVCKISESEQLLDIRVFINGEPTIKGIQLRSHVWRNLLSYSGLIEYKLRKSTNNINS